jgi:glycosyltransferase involved in cell wall biosynthesis
MSNKAKILFIVPSMRGGGAERVISTLLQYIDKEKFDLNLALITKEGKFLDDIPNHVNIIDLDAKRVRNSIFKIIKTINSLKPDIVFSTLGHLNLLISIIRPFLSKKIVFIGRESNTVSVINKQSKYPKLFDFLYNNFYNNFDHIVAQAEYMKKDLVESYQIKKEKITVINNPIDFENIKRLSNISSKDLFDKSKINLLAVGRLSHQKGFDTLLEIMRNLDDKYFLSILGQGPDEKKLKAMIKDFSLESKVKLLGFQDNPYIYMKQADIFVLSSRFEGLPNVVLEANACGTNVIAFDCPGGTSEIIVDGENGYLAKCQDKNDFIEKLKKIPLEKEINQNLLNKYEVSQIVKTYENLFQNTLKGKNK